MSIAKTCALAFLICAIHAASAEDLKPRYPVRAALAEYLATSPADEKAVARSAAPPSISDDADILTLGSRGYETAVKGKNGFACLVFRSWAADYDNAEFWNPKVRAPICLNPASVRTVLPRYLERTRWVIGGMSLSEMSDRTKAALQAKTFVLPEPGAMCYMMSKQGYLSDDDGHWHPHLMFFASGTDGGAWGANLKDSPVLAAQSKLAPVITYLIAVDKWSDGSSDEMAKHE